MIGNNRDVPEKPGVYLFKSKNGKILYIGKAKNLKKRIDSYFRNRQDPVTASLLKRAHHIDHIITESENDALQLEYNFIHTYRPAYNVRLKDDKSFPFIELTTGDPFPGIYVSRQTDPKSFLIGPIADAHAARRMVDLVIRLFRIRCCSNTVFGKQRACLYFYIDRCTAPCEQKVSLGEYDAQVNRAMLFLRGRTAHVIGDLKKEMRRHSDDLAFENAQQIKEQIDLIASVDLQSYISKPTRADFDAIAVHADGGEALVLRFVVKAGSVSHRDIFSFQTLSGKQNHLVGDFLLSHYDATNMPRVIIVPVLPADHHAIEGLFASIAGFRVEIRVPQKGQKRRILDLATANLNETIRKTDYQTIARILKEQLQLKQVPDIIEGIDISHLSGTHRVGAVVVFKNGKPERSQYRNYNIRGKRAGDTDALMEVMQRRFRSGRPQPPDLLIIDGGKPQLNAVKKVKQQFNLTSDMVAIAKREERIYLEHGGSVVLPSDSPQRFLIQNIRDEVHRRAIQHHRKKREKITGN